MTSQLSPRRRLRCLATSSLVLAVILAGAGAVSADWIWTPDSSWVDRDSEIPNTPENLFRECAKAFEAKRYTEAALGYQLLVDSFPEADLTPAARTQLMESQFRGKLYDDCLETIESIFATKPDAETVSKLIQRKYEIGTAFVTGTRRSFFGISVSAETYGVELLDALVERFPYQPYSDDALYHIAAHFQRRRQFLEAEVVYERLIKDYPQSDWASMAEYQIGASALSRLKGVEYDFTPVEEAERRFRRYLRNYPGGDRTRAAKAGLTQVSSLRAEKLFGIAQFYQREGKPEAVRIYLLRLILDHPDAPVARKAQELLRKIDTDRRRSPTPERGGEDDA